MLKKIQDNLKISKENEDEWGIQLWTSLLNAYNEGYADGCRDTVQRQGEEFTKDYSEERTPKAIDDDDEVEADLYGNTSYIDTLR